MKNTFQTVLLSWKSELGNLYDEAEIKSIFRIVLEDILGLNDAIFKMRSDNQISDEQSNRLQQVLVRLKLAEPIQYITGFTFFDDLKIVVSDAVLIPRPETEELTHWIVSESNSAKNILDVCTGSGCIALALKNHLPDARMTATDVSNEALEVAKKNADILSLDIEVVYDDALSSLIEGKFDIIVSNPPYIPQSEKQLMHSNVVEFEPGIALFVPDNDPLLFYREITLFAIRQLLPKGRLFFELHENYAAETAEMIKNTGEFNSVEVKADLQGKSRMLRAVKN